MRALRSTPSTSVRLALFAHAALWLAACGGGGPGTESAQNTAAPVQIASAVTVFGMDGSAPRIDAADVVIEPTYHLAPVLPPPPSGVDAGGWSLSARMAPQKSVVPESLSHASTRGLAVERLAASAPLDATPDAGGTGAPIVTYSPAQIRAAYGLPPIPSNLAGLTALQSAQFGAGSTIYVVDAQHDPFAYSELLALSQLFGLPSCSQVTLASNAPLPLSTPSANGCEFLQVASTKSGGISASMPAYDPSWATEIALDVQWAHAIAPFARIVLIEAPDASLGGLSGAIQLANKMGPGVVSMSFGGAEGDYVTSMDSYFQTTGMSYFAATGDGGAGVSWPAVSPYVVAVGGTSLTYGGSGARSETVWSLTGGGISAYEPTPSYQTAAVPGLGTPAHRSVADVAFNADPNRGQYVAVIRNQTTCTFCQVSWITVGGTSLATPQWAGLAAVANAMRARAGKPPLGDLHGLLYGQVANVAANYSTDFADITQGNDGTCATCIARKGYDTPTGLGTPNGLSLLNALAGAAVPTTPPVVTGATVNGAYGQVLSFTASVSAANPYTLSLSGAPSGMTIAPNAVVTWSAPIAGTRAVTVIAKDTKTGATGQGVYNIVVAPPPPPRVSSGSIGGSAGKALTFNVGIGDVNPCTVTLSGAPAGMTVTPTGLVSWPRPVTGSYSITVTARDNATGSTGQGTYTVAISVPLAPSVQSGSVSAKPGGALNFNVGIADANPYTVSLSGAPSGMSIGGSGTVNWANPIAGNYTVTVIAKDSKTGLSGEGMYVVKVGSATGPAVAATTLQGVAGKPLNGTITISDAGAGLIGVGLFGAPLGVSFSPQGGGFNTMGVSWPNPVTGSYTIQVSATDSAGLQAQVTVPMTITAN